MNLAHCDAIKRSEQKLAVAEDDDAIFKQTNDRSENCMTGNVNDSVEILYDLLYCRWKKRRIDWNVE